MERVCARCKREIKDNEVVYYVRISITQGEVLEIDDSNTPSDREILDMMEGIKDLPEEFFNEEVFEEKEFILCERCAEIFRANPFCRPVNPPGELKDANWH